VSIFGKIMSAIFGSSTAAAAGVSATAAAPAASAPPAAPPPPLSKAEVESLIAKIADKKGVKYNWKESIVDLMKLLDLDSSLAARKELAQELGYSGALDGSAAMNIWLHQQVMAKLATSGGKLPADFAR
jgi:hypothetical protein